MAQLAPDAIKFAPRLRAVAPAVAVNKPVAPAAPRTVDVAQFRILPLSGAPQVSAAVDETLGKTGLASFILLKLEAAGALGLKLANGVRCFTRLAGPAMYVYSAFRNARMLPAVLKDQTLNASSKVALVLGTIATGIGAAAAVVSAAPAKLAGLLGLSSVRQVLANKISGIAGGIAGLGFAAINLVETLRNPESKPGERFFAKAGFAVGAVGFVAGTLALALSMGALGGAPALLAIASKVATGAGIAGLATWIGQLCLGKNAWLNQKLEGSALA